MEELKLIANSYDRTIDMGRKGVDPYVDLPHSITSHPYLDSMVTQSVILRIIGKETYFYEAKDSSL